MRRTHEGLLLSAEDLPPAEWNSRSLFAGLLASFVVCVMTIAGLAGRSDRGYYVQTYSMVHLSPVVPRLHLPATPVVMPHRASHIMATAGPEAEDDIVSAIRMQISEGAKLSPTEVGPELTGEELLQLVVDKWGKKLDTRITKRKDRFWVEVMWTHADQKSFPLTMEQFEQQLDAVAWQLTNWRVQDQVRREIEQTEKRPWFARNKGKSVLLPLQLPPDADTEGW
uniref:Uncharacterized protein n=1 Tax=Eutreptiella gymnastica TaxID=73025 RepID=A0A6U8GA02_9EUGL|mmetsp:Transcript_47362/g.84718  ORF Transcript_47362/g.84718 Transcript_47362/m.84718 type:complete len:225 (+) Transcript_47362:34-708(+)